MSYDIDIGDESFNYTFNVSKLFYDHIPDMGKGGGLRELDGLTGSQAGKVLVEGLSAIGNSVSRDWSHDDVGEPVFCARYDSKNGWGSALGGILFLTGILGACIRHPRSKVRVGI